ncbi:hypothetical protein [Streptomyces sp. TRM68367]|uniref:hypothetical protein n=1 Tax=Streptomyces sp. TRM68367 TaxID=2758415 RepID=UPI00165CAAA0|nr:hypothetical protein [Streptomyces sp. TRM68367]MBC9726121.1 hypothetical protein [Streptomyces sp. TRM68367]
MNIARQVETAELSDAALDSVSGGQAGVPALGGGGSAGLYIEAGPLTVSGGGALAASPQGIAGDLHFQSALNS